MTDCVCDSTSVHRYFGLGPERGCEHPRQRSAVQRYDYSAATGSLDVYTLAAKLSGGQFSMERILISY